MDIDFTATEDTTAAFQCEMLLEVIKPDGEEPEEMSELSVVYKMNNETIDGFMPTKTCLYGKHIVTLFFPISKVIENSSNTFSMYLKISHGSITIGEAQIRATISGQGLAAGLGDWNGRININQNIGFIPVGDKPFMVDLFEDKATVILPQRKNNGVTQSIGNIAITKTNFFVDSFTDRTWIAEILRTYVLTSVRGFPKYNGFITINSNEQFLLRTRYILDSEPDSLDRGFSEELTIDTSFLADVSEIEVNGHLTKYRPLLLVNTANTAVIYPEEVDITSGRFELKVTTSEKQTAETMETEEGYLECLTIDISSWQVKQYEVPNTANTNLRTDSCWQMFVASGYLLIKKYDSPYDLYKIQISNPANITEFKRTNCSSINGAAKFVINDRVYFENGNDQVLIADLLTNEIMPPECQSFFNTSNWLHITPVRNNKLLYFADYGTWSTAGWYMFCNYLATINNLDTPVTKTADKTMKITYILQEE